jgi:hypothetical protein
MFQSETLSRAELEERYEQAGVLIHLIKQALPDAVFDLLLQSAGILWGTLKKQEGDKVQTNLPPGWVVFKGEK